MAQWVWRGYWGTTFADTAKAQAEALDPSVVGAVYPQPGKGAVSILGGTIKFFMIALRSDVTPPALTGVTQNDAQVVTYLTVLYGD